MTKHIDFEYDAKDDILIVTPHWHVRTEADVAAWADEYHRYFARFQGRKVDCIYVLTDFKVDARVGTIWGEARAKINNAYTRYTYRVSIERSAATYTFTSGARYNASSAVAPSVDEARQQILRHRREEHAKAG